MDWLAILIYHHLKYKNTDSEALASAIRAEIKKRRPVKTFPDELPGELPGYPTPRKIKNETIDIYDRALGLEE